MKTLNYTMSSNLSLLNDEIMTAIPALAPTRDANGAGTPVMITKGNDTSVQLTVPDDTDEAVVQAVIDAHDASAVQTSVSIDARTTGATKLKALGLTDGEIAALQS